MVMTKGLVKTEIILIQFQLRRKFKMWMKEVKRNSGADLTIDINPIVIDIQLLLKNQ